VNHAERVLEYESVLERLGAQCETVLGAERAAEVRPLWDAELVWDELAATAEAHSLLATSPPPSLGGIGDLRAPLKRAAKGGSLGGDELYGVGAALASMRSFRTFLNARRADIPRLWPNIEHFLDERALEQRLLDSLDSDGTVLDTASTTLRGLRQKIRATAGRVTERIQSYATGKTRDLLSDPIYTVRDGRYVVPVKAENRGKIKGIVHDTSASGQTIYVEPEDVLQLGNALREAEAAERQEVARILAELSDRVGEVADDLARGVEAAADVDLVLARARLGFAMKGAMPERSAGAGIKIEGGRHPLLDPEAVVPLDMSVGFDADGLLITGPNTGGKTVAIKTAGLFVLMAQSGLMLPARQVYLGVFSQVWADIGDEQSLQQSLSTFSGHIRNIADSLKNLKKGALVLFDEIGAGTDPTEGAALAKAILKAMQAKGAKIIASTHYGELKAFAYNTPGFVNAAMEFDAKSLRPTYRLLMGAPGASHALKIAERYGIPSDLVEEARLGLTEAQQDVTIMLEKLEQAQRQARIAQGDADRRAGELRQMEARAKRKLEEADEIRRTVHAKANETIEGALREIRLEAARLFDELKSGKSVDEVRKKLKDLQSVGESFAEEFKPAKRIAEEQEAKLTKGMSVRVEGYTQVGTLLEDPTGKEALVQMGPLKVKLKTALMSPVAPPKTTPKQTNLGLQKAQTAATEIHLRQMRAEDAERQLESFLDDAVLAGLHQARIVHGKGTGILRQMVHSMLKRHRDVKSFRLGDATEGGDGVTIAVFK